MSTEPIGLTRDLAAQGVMRAQTGQTDLAVWRSTSGVVSAWENRCPHRGMRLSHGFVRGESLACAYHGWHYNCSGKCHYIPAHPELEPPASIAPIIYSVMEQAGVIWVNAAGDSQPYAIAADLASVRSITLDCDLATAVKAFTTISLTDQTSNDQISPKIAISKVSHQAGVLKLSTADISDAVLILFQQPQAQRVVSHILASSTFSNEQLIKVSRWSESVRRQAEASQPLVSKQINPS